MIKITQNHYKEVIENLKNRKNLPLRFAAYVVFDSTFGAYEIIELMLADLQHYSPKIVICPDTSRGEDFLEEQYKKTKDFFVKKRHGGTACQKGDHKHIVRYFFI